MHRRLAAGDACSAAAQCGAVISRSFRRDGRLPSEISYARRRQFLLATTSRFWHARAARCPTRPDRACCIRTSGPRVNVESGHDSQQPCQHFPLQTSVFAALDTRRAPRARERGVVSASRTRVERRRHARPLPQPPLRINIAESWQVRWWCDHLGVTHRELFDAIAAVGLSADAVRRRLER